jgi:hypothetical protein
MRRDDANALVGVAEVRGHRERVELRRGLLERLGSAGDECEVVPVLAKRVSDRQSNPG